MGGDETTGELGGIDGTGMREVDGVVGRDTEHIGCKITDDTADNVEEIGVIEDGEVDVDDEMDEDAVTEGWCVIAWIESVDDGRDTAGSVLLTASSDTWWLGSSKSRSERMSLSRDPEASAEVPFKAGKEACTAAFLAKYSSLRDIYPSTLRHSTYSDILARGVSFF